MPPEVTEPGFSAVERRALACLRACDGTHRQAASPFAGRYAPEEKIPVIVVENFPALGRLAALRFVEWAQANPGGVVSLPTGKTPQHFIEWVRHILRTWDERETRLALEDGGVDPARRPDMKSLRFVQIDEFYPIDPAQHNSFHHYVSRHYIEGFGLDAGKALLMDCSKIGSLDALVRDSVRLARGSLSAAARAGGGPDPVLAAVWPTMEVDLALRHRAARTALEEIQKRALERIDEWCQEYEARIRRLGGIGFFLGGIGPDGHIAFNVRGSDHFSTTRLTATNYETQAAAAADLGGIETARRRLVVTIGLGTITFNPSCAAIILAAGAAKARVVADAVEKPPDVLYPATALHGLPNARFYVTRGAAERLQARRYALLVQSETADDEVVERALIDLAVRLGRRLVDLSRDDIESDRFAAEAARIRPGDAVALARAASESLARKVERGAKTLEKTRFLHTEPHHDDLMLGCLPAIVRNMRSASNSHHFATLTSGFTAVTNAYMKRRLEHLAAFLDDPGFLALAAEGYFDPADRSARNRDLWQYLDGIAARDERARDEGAARRLASDLIELAGGLSACGHAQAGGFGGLRGIIADLVGYIDGAYPGSKDPERVQRLKGMCREWEAECLWGYFGWSSANVRHLRLSFYTGDVFTPEPTADRDVPPILDIIREVRPDVVSVALDPEASGPDTHYKVTQAIHAAIRRYEAEGGGRPLRIWGYRNVWYRFHPAEANMHVPVSLNMFSVMERAFMDTFISQREASFPSHEYDGPFCGLAQRIQVEQYQAVKTCLGRQWFHEHPNALIRATRGLVFMKEMDAEEFYRHSRELSYAITGSGGPP